MLSRWLVVSSTATLAVFSMVLGCVPAGPGPHPRGEGEGDATGEGEGDGSGEGEGEGEGEGAGEAPDAAETVSADDGGTVSLGATSVEVPPGALPDDTEITITAQEGEVPGFEVISDLFEFGPDGLQFEAPVAVTLPFVGDPAGKIVFWEKEDGSGYEPVPTQPGNGTMVAFVSHFSGGFIGAGNAEECAGVVCDDRPAPVCNGDGLVLSGAGVCVAGGTCSYPTIDFDCAAAPGGAGSCADGACRVGSCDSGRADCDGAFFNGCEANLASDATCGSCEVACDATSRCNAGACEARACVQDDDCAVEPRCNADDSGTVGAVMTCSSDQCALAANTEDPCAAGEVCANGACSACSTDTQCGTASAPTCNGDALVVSGPSCTAGGCSTAEESFTCAFGCADGRCAVPQGACGGGEDCPAGQACQDGHCLGALGCASDTECGPDSRCVDGACDYQGPAHPPCLPELCYPGSCSAGGECIGLACAVDGDCPEADRCEGTLVMHVTSSCSAAGFCQPSGEAPTECPAQQLCIDLGNGPACHAQGSECATDQECGAAEASCEGDVLTGTLQRCEFGYCSSRTVQEHCNSSQLLCDGSDVVRNTGSCVVDHCEQTTAVDHTCGGDTPHCLSATCVAEGVECVTPHDCFEGPHCDGDNLVFSEGQCVDGLCQDAAGGGGVVQSCPNGCSVDHCVDGGGGGCAGDGDCPAQAHCVEGLCEPLCTPQTCAFPGSCVDGACVANSCSDDGDCPSQSLCTDPNYQGMVTRISVCAQGACTLSGEQPSTCDPFAAQNPTFCVDPDFGHAACVPAGNACETPQDCGVDASSCDGSQLTQSHHRCDAGYCILDTFVQNCGGGGLQCAGADVVQSTGVCAVDHCEQSTTVVESCSGATPECLSGTCVAAGTQCVSGGDCSQLSCDGDNLMRTEGQCVDGQCDVQGTFLLQPCPLACVTDHCVECLGDGDCGASGTCVDGQCQGDPPGCSPASCPPPNTCIADQCMPPSCSVDGDCGADATCVGGTCQPNAPQCTPQNCPPPATCVADQCRPPGGCVMDVDCGATGVCVNGTCH